MRGRSKDDENEITTITTLGYSTEMALYIANKI